MLLLRQGRNERRSITVQKTTTFLTPQSQPSIRFAHRFSVWKDNFCFINTNDPFGISRARAALQGWLVNGSPLKINDAIKRGDNMPTNNPGEIMQISERIKMSKAPLPMLPSGGVDYTAIRDDKNNPVSANLWVGGFNNR